MKYSLPQELICAIHNLKGYDSHLIMQGITKLKKVFEKQKNNVDSKY